MTKSIIKPYLKNDPNRVLLDWLPQLVLIFIAGGFPGVLIIPEGTLPLFDSIMAYNNNQSRIAFNII